MSRVKTVTNIPHEFTAIQFVRGAIGEVYEFNEGRDLTMSFINNKFSGTLKIKSGEVIPVTGKDWLIKDVEGNISVCSPQKFESIYRLIGDNTMEEAE